MGLFYQLMEVDYENDARVPGVITGIVKENWDKDHPGMVKVEMFLGEQGKNLTGWVPVTTPYGGSGYGAYALPEIGQEVVIAFHMGDRNCPLVIGSLWNNKNKLPPETATEKNLIKKFRTKGGCEVIFQEEEKKEKIQVQTPGKMSILIDDEKKSIEIKDEKGENGILIDGKNGTLTLKAKTKMELKVGDNAMVTLDGNSKTAQIKADNIKAEATQGLTLKGQNDKLEGAMIAIKAQSSLKVESSAIAELKGTMVKIN